MQTLASPLFGTPNRGIHSIRLFNISIIDTLMTLFFAYLLSIKLNYPFWIISIGLFILGIVMHRLFKVHTTIDKLLFN